MATSHGIAFTSVHTRLSIIFLLIPTTMANVRLTKGFIGSQVFWCSIPEAQKLLETLPPTNVQVLSLKKVGEPDKPRYRLIISDGEHYAHAMLHASQNNLVERQYLGKFSVISILKMTAGDRPAPDCHK